MVRKFFLVGLLVLSILLVSCIESPKPIEQVLPWETDQFDRDQVTIVDYLNENSITFSADTILDVKYVLHAAGNHINPDDNSQVTVSYAGRILGDSTNFDAGKDITFLLEGLISGWRLLIPYMGEGGSMTMYLPSGLGYGARESASIPANSNLVFDVELHKVN